MSKKKRCNARRDAVRQYRSQHPGVKYTHARARTAPSTPIVLGPWPALVVSERALSEAGIKLNEAVSECISSGDDGAVIDAEQLTTAAVLTVWLTAVLAHEQAELAARAMAPSDWLRGGSNFGLQPPPSPGALTRVRFGPELAELLRWPAVGLPGFVHQSVIRAVGDLYGWALQHR